ncbi:MULTISPECIES: hypothetical protein [unclassified Microbacterium]|uniref:hypothetical protein n=1 Tax=unclassified Microbacterium TaxID=2609290 RepID=UPI0025DC922A|nr:MULTISPECIES: hypothetical protein [unclassified Microbacterium]
MAAANEETPGLAAEGFENIPNTAEEQEMNDSTVDQTADNCEGAFGVPTIAEIRERNIAARSAWLAEHPEVAALKPDWAETLDVDDLDGVDGVDLWAERDFGPVRLIAHASYLDGRVTWDGEVTTPNVVVERDYVEELTVTQMRELASALMAAIPLVEAATA